MWKFALFFLICLTLPAEATSGAKPVLPVGTTGIAPVTPAKPAWELEYDTLASEPTAKTTDVKNDDGTETRTVTLPGPVVVTYNISKDRKATGVGQDESGRPGVMCMWNLYTGLRGFMVVCPQKDDTAVKAMLDKAIDRIDDFIVENNIPRTSKANLQTMADNQLKRVQTRLKTAPKEQTAKACAGDASKLLKAMRSMSPEKFTKNVDDLLSVPRLPVMNPCL